MTDKTTKKIGRPVRIVETGQEFDSVNECAEAIDGIASRISECLMGKKKRHRGYTFEALGEYNRGFDFNNMPKFQAKKCPVRIIETGQEFKSLSDCARSINGRASNIWLCLTGKQKTHRGYTFERINNEATD